MTGPLRCAVLTGDGIGPEIVPVAERVLLAATARAGGAVETQHLPVGFAALAEHGTTFPDDTAAALHDTDGWILGPVDTAAYPPPAEGGLNPSGECRKRFRLTSNIRPARALPGVPCRFPELDCVVVRENTEGFYADRSMVDGTGELPLRDDLALAVGVFSAERIAAATREAVRLARERRGRVVLAHKANVLPRTMGLYLETARAVCAEAPEVTFDDLHLDALAARLVLAPEEFDVIVAENLGGDVLSDLTAGMVGGLGLAPSLNVGDDAAMAQAVHGSAPQIAGRGIANPSALVLSVAMLLRWWQARKAAPWCAAAAGLVEAAVAQTLAGGLRTPDLGGTASTVAFGHELVRRIET
ncbi:isocitrate/isopropylmalate dehydrogenase family protein [Jiangella asiatica]|uniref:Isocitrate/isopropylmalate dehydrogenase family protein n=1 Tax=Jiangella asiatica TaxID=2530372 RepID=A0A4R5D6I2_9ACTN|nr:isocitrate/isopropylmalate family dehydrogenase [Jiangella asiatica]TDE07450.1 isocitrate/isopropylmalate dehydrogenase family protein [Jiangella asiatica]